MPSSYWEPPCPLGVETWLRDQKKKETHKQQQQKINFNNLCYNIKNRLADTVGGGEGEGGTNRESSSVQLFAIPWTVESMEFSRPEYWSG